MKAGTQNHIKLRRLKRLLNLPLYRVVGILETLWLLCADCCDEGQIGKYTDEEIADYLEWEGPDASGLVRALADAGWIDRDADNRLVIHDWLDHCPEYIKDRVRKREARAGKGRKSKEITTYVSSQPDTTGQERTQPGPAAAATVYSQPIPTQPIPTPPPPNHLRALEEEVSLFGVHKAREAVSAAIAAGCSADDIRAALAYARQHGGGWDKPPGAGALYAKLLAMKPGHHASRDFPEAKAPVLTEEGKRAAQEKSRKDRVDALIRSGKAKGESDEEIERQIRQLA